MARKKGVKSSNKSSTSSVPPQKHQSEQTRARAVPKGKADAEPTKTLLSDNPTAERNSNYGNIENPQEVSGAQALPKFLQHPKKSTYAATLQRPIPLARNLSVSTFSTNVTVDSSTDSKVSANTSGNDLAFLSDSSDGDRYYSVVNDEESLHEFLTVINKVEDYTVDIFVDAEGENGHGAQYNLNSIQVKMVSQDRRWILDPTILGDQLFDTPCKTGKKRTWREILENEIIPVVFWDVRADSNSIHGHHKVHLGGVIDLQVMEMVTRGSCPTWRHGLSRCIHELPDNKLPEGFKSAWEERNLAGKRVCSGPEEYGAFNRRPLPRELEEYAINDVELMPELFNYYSVDRGLCDDTEKMRLVMEVSKKMVELSIAPDYNVDDSHSNRRSPPELLSLWGGYNPYDDYFYY